MNTVPFFPSNQPWYVWAVVISASSFWLVAYVLIVYRGFKERTFGMPIAAFCANIVWEVLFSHVFPPNWLLIRIGNDAWVLFDVAILITVWKYGRDDFADPFVKKWYHPLIVVGLLVAAVVEYPFAVVYNDHHGYLLGWAAALMMSVLFIALLLRRGNVKGQSCYIALTMFLGNMASYFWCEVFPDSPPLMDHRMNLACFTTTGFFNLTYLVMVYRRCRELGINPWTRW